MAGDIRTLNIGGRQLSVRNWTQEENDAFERDFYSMIAQYDTNVAIDTSHRHIMADIYYNAKELIKTFGMLCAKEIDPTPGIFGGMMEKGGYNMRKIRPDDIFLSTGQGRTFDYSLSGLTANNWYAVIDSAAIGGAVTAALYMRKFLGTIILGVLDTGGNPIFDELQWTSMEGSSLPIENIVEPMRATNMSLYEFINPVFLRPAKKYQMAGKVNAIGGSGALVFIGVTFIRYEELITQQPTTPQITAP